MSIVSVIQIHIHNIRMSMYISLCYSGKAVRSCGSDGQWTTPVVENCTSYAYRTLMSLMEEVDMCVLTFNLHMLIE